MADTNILVSLLFFPSPQVHNVRRLLAMHCQLLVNDYSLDELYFVAAHKFQREMHIVQSVMELLPFTLIHASTIIDDDIVPQMRDSKDRPILASAIEHDADVLLTGDKDFLALNIKRPRIMSMSQFLETFAH